MINIHSGGGMSGSHRFWISQILPNGVGNPGINETVNWRQQCRKHNHLFKVGLGKWPCKYVLLLLCFYFKVIKMVYINGGAIFGHSSGRSNCGCVVAWGLVGNNATHYTKFNLWLDLADGVLLTNYHKTEITQRRPTSVVYGSNNIISCQMTDNCCSLLTKFLALCVPLFSASL